MATSLPLFMCFSLFILLHASYSINITQGAASKTVAKDIVPCSMCDGCENPCQPLPPPPVVECPPPPLPPPPPAPVVECPPPPKTSCQDCETPQLGPPVPLGQLYFPPGTPNPYYVKNKGQNMRPSFFHTASFMCHVFLFLIITCLFI